MHELAVTQSILNVALESAREAKAQKIIEIKLVIGELSSIVDDSVQFYFDIMSEGTEAEGATLNIKRIPARFECTVCKQQFVRKGHSFRCPHCGGDAKICEGANEFYIESMVVED